MTDQEGGVTRYVTTRLGLIDAMRSAGLKSPSGGVREADAVLACLPQFPVTVPRDLRDRIDAALGESMDSCARCKVCDNQLDAIMAVIGPHAERLAELENAITWGTSCLSCSAVLDSSIRDHERAERAEAELAAIKPQGPAAETEPLPPGYFARVELPGWRNYTGWFTEGTMGGEPVMVVSDWDGHRVAVFKPGPNSLVVHLPTPLRRPEPQRAITGGTLTSLGARWDYSDDEPDREPF